MAFPVMMGDSRAWALKPEDNQTVYVVQTPEALCLDGNCLCVGVCCCLDASGRPKAASVSPRINLSDVEESLLTGSASFDEPGSPTLLDESDAGNSPDEMNVPLPSFSNRRHARGKPRKHQTGRGWDCAQALLEPTSSD
mmetsp:Transcript_72601/g.132996  ORF Transcript_72601/g.132996 Transcript_72601/m.132996 type:complete len:139 (+) Transcript_72601:65-481(+)